ncbi:MAG: hypothetical protein B6D61_06745 [Bacteroidetes bacterium 4484_249]|nr:MAG: hypothetical protein B6D61_06745 [Bacteroidetes bacterium 4484_249]
MIFSKYRIKAKGNFFNMGFGFSCMQLAFKNDFTGTLFYESAESVILEITGREEDIINVIDIWKREDYISNIHILFKTKTENKLTDFIMLNQIN